MIRERGQVLIGFIDPGERQVTNAEVVRWANSMRLALKAEPDRVEGQMIPVDRMIEPEDLRG